MLHLCYACAAATVTNILSQVITMTSMESGVVANTEHSQLSLLVALLRVFLSCLTLCPASLPGLMSPDCHYCLPSDGQDDGHGG